MNEEIIKLLNEIYQYDDVLKRKLLMLDADAIRSIAENNYHLPDKLRKKYIADGRINELIEIELKIKKLYFLLLDEYYNNEIQKINLK